MFFFRLKLVVIVIGFRFDVFGVDFVIFFSEVNLSLYSKGLVFFGKVGVRVVSSVLGVR